MTRNVKSRPASVKDDVPAFRAGATDHLLFAIEEQALAEARRSVESTRARYARAATL